MYLTLLDKPSSDRRKNWFICMCGAEKEINKQSVKHFKTLSCGCHKKHVQSLAGLNTVPKTGQKFNYLTFLGLSPSTGVQIRRGVFSCECGNKTSKRINAVKTNHTTSCGCLNSLKTHGLTGTRQYKIWANMVTRCSNPNSSSYKNYGGRGITVCERWKLFENFWEDIRDIYDERFTIDRIDNSKNYEPSNVAFTDKSRQNSNKRHKEGASGCKGVYQRKSSWLVQFNYQKQTFRRYGIKCKLEAVMIYHQKYLELVGAEPYYQTMP